MSEDPDLFEQWSELNKVTCDWRSRFDRLRDELPGCRTRAEAERLLVAEGYGQRFPLLPDWLP